MNVALEEHTIVYMQTTKLAADTLADHTGLPVSIRHINPWAISYQSFVSP
jgi:hypothetical protein